MDGRSRASLSRLMLLCSRQSLSLAAAFLQIEANLFYSLYCSTCLKTVLDFEDLSANLSHFKTLFRCSVWVSLMFPVRILGWSRRLQISPDPKLVSRNMI